MARDPSSYRESFDRHESGVRRRGSSQKPGIIGRVVSKSGFLLTCPVSFSASSPDREGVHKLLPWCPVLTSSVLLPARGFPKERSPGPDLQRPRPRGPPTTADGPRSRGSDPT